jgi:hypothetical protein
VLTSRAVAQTELQYDRPPEGLQRGRYAAPKWAIAALGVAVVLGALAFLVWRARRAVAAPARDALRQSRRP